MCAIAGLLSTVASVAGTGMSMMGSLEGGQATATAMETKAKIASANAHLMDTEAQIAQGNAGLAITRGNYDQFLAKRKIDQTLATQKADYASGNVDPTFGSPLFMQGYSAAQGETTLQLIRAGMLKDKANALTQAANIQGQAVTQAGTASADLQTAVASLISGGIGAGTAFLKGVQKWPGLHLPTASASSTSYAMPFSSDPFLLH